MTNEAAPLEERDLGAVTVRFSSALSLERTAAILSKTLGALPSQGPSRSMRLRLGTDSVTLIGPAEQEAARVRLTIARDIGNSWDDVVAPVVRRSRTTWDAPATRAHVRIALLLRNLLVDRLQSQYTASAWEDAVIHVEITDESAILWTANDGELRLALRADPARVLIERWREPWVQGGETAATG